MMAGNPNWWNMHMHPPSSLNPHHHQPSSLLSSSSTTNSSSSSLFSQYVGVGGSPASSLPQDSFADNNNHEQLPQSWSQLLMGGLSSAEEDKMGLDQFQATKRFSNWDDQLLLNPTLGGAPTLLDVKQEEVSSLLQNNNSNNHHYMYGHGVGGIGSEEFQVAASWSHHMNINPVASSSPRSCVTSPSPSANILDFSNNNKTSLNARTHQHHSSDHLSSSECNSTATGGACKKARVQSSSSLSPLKVRKEKLGDRITALHQLVSPFGKTDTASVLLEAIGYIRFLQGQIEALSSPYLGNGSGNTRHLQSEDENKPKDLRSRGLCLVPVSCMLQDGSDNGADYWAPALGGGF